ncbi:dTDP-4-dehydrorhamnose 3,5-epimerase (plasmid) [Peteryoungia desertarenae]|uniref:dTDP-4-dehydrorhamnose 3,5-epimerase n=1 Tax=Peteryoungia desertarenae TaxID=1813451 RepID=A0ABX6QU03_9HYPH|nr:dTDP-4-dehydrorhamnose 3,5-epimerase [Peteryoungia desertarenae]QLF71761.1 dTDP-4-dehydrorhamnose 3,5-epimerase [Peteryoungia desertarenae]
MKLTPTAIVGAFHVEVSPIADHRGLFARTFCAETFASCGLESVFPQCNLSFSPHRGTLRGLHFQAEPHAEAKLVRATRGRVFEVALDLRPHSPSYMKWASVELDATERNAFYIPPGCAHGLLTLEDECEVFSQMSTAYHPPSARIARWNDPAFAISWPFEPLILSDKDAECACYRPQGATHE